MNSHREHKGHKKEIVELTTRAMAVMPGTLDEAGRSVEAVITTEAPAAVWDWASYTIIDEVLLMSGARFKRQIPLLDMHSRYTLSNIMGSVRDIRLEGERLVGRLYFAESEEAEAAWQLVRGGHLTDVSAGYVSRTYTEIKPGESAVVAGKTYTAGARTLRVTSLWDLKEESLVVIGADEQAKIRADAGGMPVLRTIEAGGMPALHAAMTADKGERTMANEKANVMETPAVEMERAAPEGATSGVDVEARVRDAEARGRRDEIKRRAEIEAIFSAETPEETRRAALEPGVSVDQARAMVLDAERALRTPAVGTMVEVGADRKLELRTVLVDALTIRAGYAIEEPKRVRAADEFRGIGARNLAALCIEADGGGRAPWDPDELHKRSISTSSLPVILGEGAQRVLAREYMETPGSFVQWAGRREVPDFKTMKEVTLSDFAQMQQMAPGAEIKFDGLSEKYESYRAYTYAKGFAWTREQIFNDDLGAFLRIPQLLGRRMRQNINHLGNALLVSASGVGPTMTEDSLALFSKAAGRVTSGGANYVTETSASSLNKTGLDNGKKAMRLIKGAGQGGIGGLVLNLKPRWLLAPAALESAALEYTQSPNFSIALAGTTDADVTRPSLNIHQGTVTPIIEAELDDATNGTTAWYLIADANDQASLVVVYLRGNETPVIEQVTLSNVLGIGFRGYHDAGVAAVDWRGIVRMKGAAA